MPTRRSEKSASYRRRSTRASQSSRRSAFSPSGSASPFPDAFELLRAAARKSRREVRALAEELGTSRETPSEIAELLPSSDDEAAQFMRCPSCGTLVVLS